MPLAWLGPVKAPSISETMTSEGPSQVSSQPPTGGPALNFRADAETVEAAPVALYEGIIEKLHSKIPGSQNIKEFLSRPYMLSHGNLTATDSGILWKTDPFNSLQTSLKKEKLNGIYMFRADVEIVINVNASKFQTGRYIIGFVPSGGCIVTTPGYVRKFRAHTANLQTITSTHHVEIDLGTQTTATLVIPFMSIYPMHRTSLTLAEAGIGYVYLIPYVPLAAASGSTSAGYTIWGKYTNIVLGAPALSQGDDGSEEAEAAGVGPVTKMVRKVGQAATILGEIPLISSGAYQVAWAADIIARASHVFGWSKPLDLDAPEYIITRRFPNLQNVDGIDTAHQTATVSTNRVVSSPHSNGVDEMSLKFITSLMTHATMFSWTPSASAGTFLWTSTVNPFVFEQAYGHGWTNTAVGSMTLMFELWRGSLKYKFKFVKNQFYSGRLMFFWNPSVAGTLPGNLAQTEYLHRSVVDVRDMDEYEVTIPYTNMAQYCSRATSVGTVGFVVLDPLIAPSTVPQSISVIVEIAGGDDFELARPNLISEPYVPVVSQAGDIYGEVDVSLDYAKACIGEKIESLRQLAKLNMRTFNTIVSAASGQVIKYSPYLYNYPTQITSNATAVARGQSYTTWNEFVTFFYSMVTGSYRVQVLTLGGSLTVSYGYGSTTTKYSNASFDASSSDSMRGIDNDVDGCFDIVVPPYQTTIGRSVAVQMTSTTTDSFSYGQDATLTCLCVRPVGTPVFAPMISYQAADDFNAYGFCGTFPYIGRTQT